MLLKSFFKIVLGMALFACISTQSYAKGTPRVCVMRVVSKAVFDGGASLAKGTLFIARNTVVAANKLGGTVMTIGGTAISEAEASLKAWGFLVDSYSNREGEPEYIIDAIEKVQFLNSPSIEDITADDGQSPGLYLATWLYGAAEPVIYFLYEQVFPSTHEPFLYGKPKLQNVFHAVSRYPARYLHRVDAPKFDFYSGTGTGKFNFNFNFGN